MLQRATKTFSTPAKPDAVGPSNNTLTLDLGGLRLTEQQIAMIRAEAVKAALLTTFEATKGANPNVLADFGTFSTFSTFSSFGSAGGTPVGLPDRVRDIIEDTTGKKLEPAKDVPQKGTGSK